MVEWTIPASITIALTGVIANTLSLSYFLRKERKGLFSRLFIALNVSDLVLSVLMLISGILKMEGVGDTSQTAKILALQIMDDIFVTIRNGTTWTTLLIYTTSAIKACDPHNRIKVRRMVIATIIYSGYNVPIFVFRATAHSYPPLKDNPKIQKNVLKFDFVEGLLVTIPVLLYAMQTTVTLFRVVRKKVGPEEVQGRDSHDAITALILSVIMLVCNIPTQVLITVRPIHPELDVLKVSSGANGAMILGDAAPILLLPLKAVLNPIVYFARKQTMRLFFLNSPIVERCATMRKRLTCFAKPGVAEQNVKQRKPVQSKTPNERLLESKMILAKVDLFMGLGA